MPRFLLVCVLLVAVNVNAALLSDFARKGTFYGQTDCPNFMVHRCTFFMYEKRRMMAKTFKSDPYQFVLQLVEYHRGELIELDPDLLLSI